MSAGLEQAPGYTPVDVVKATVVTVVMALVLSFVYGPADYYSPLVYLNIVLAGGMGWVVGRCGRAMLRRFRIDGTRAATLVGVVGALFALWFSWLTYLWVVFSFDSEVFSLFANPANLWGIMGEIAENPIWTLSRRGRSMSGGPGLMYWGVWLVEAGLFVFFSVAACREFVATNKLCPQCGQWLRATGDVARFVPPASSAALANFVRGDLAVLKSLIRLAPNAEAESWLDAACYACGQCEGLNAHVTVSVSVVKTEKNKKPQVTKTIIANMVEITPEFEAELFHPEKAAEAVAVEAVETEVAAEAEEISQPV